MSVHCSSYADWTAPGLRKKKEIKVAQSKGRGQKIFIAKKIVIIIMMTLRTKKSIVFKFCIFDERS